MAATSAKHQTPAASVKANFKAKKKIVTKHKPTNATALPKDYQLARLRPDDLLSGRSLQAMFGVAPAVIYEWRNKGMPCKQADTNAAPLFHPASCIRWRRERDRDLRNKIPGEKPNDARSRKLDAEAERAQLQVQIQRGLLIDVAIFKRAVEMIVGDFAGVAKGQLSQFERDIVTAANPVDARRLTERMTDELLRGAQRYRETLEKDLESGKFAAIAEQLEREEPDEEPPNEL